MSQFIPRQRHPPAEEVVDGTHAYDLAEVRGKGGSRHIADSSKPGDRPTVSHVCVHSGEGAGCNRIAKTGKQPDVFLTHPQRFLPKELNENHFYKTRHNEVAARPTLNRFCLVQL